MHARPLADFLMSIEVKLRVRGGGFIMEGCKVLKPST